MNSTNAFRSILLALTLGGVAAAGCVITVGPLDCSECDSEALCHNHTGGDINGDGEADCFCDAGYTWAEPSDPNDFECDRIPPKPDENNCIEDNSNVQNGECFCNDGFVWCSDAPSDLTCCVDESQDSVGDTDNPTGDPSVTEGETEPTSTSSETDSPTSTGTGSQTETGVDPDTGSGGSELPECNEQTNNMFACTNDNPETPQNGAGFLCTDGTWTELDADAECQSSGFDFAYGCAIVNEGDPAEFVCGDGPGTDCTSDEDACVDATSLNFCLYGRLSTANCEAFCQDPNNKTTFDTGFCEDAICECCDEGDEGCPL